MLTNVRKNLALNYLNYRGWRTTRKIIVLASDDWGSIRMPSKKVYERFLDKGFSLDKSTYCRYDSLASEEDLISLFNLLSKFKDQNNNHPVITANCVVTNPDFYKIKKSKYQEYFEETFTETLERYPMHSRSFELWNEGQKNRLFYPQSHGKVHLNIMLWMRLLRSKHSFFLKAFENQFWGINIDVLPEMKINIQATFDANDPKEIKYHQNIVKTGLKLFERIFDFKSKSFIANNFVWDSILNEVLYNCDVKYIQGMKYQKLPLFNKRRKLIRHFTGEVNNYDQIHVLRNCTFEPSLRDLNFDNIGECLRGISNAFLWRRPAVITSHRLNYIGYIDPKNRSRNLESMNKLLNEIMKNWPDVEFMTIDQLGDLIYEDIKI